MPRAVAPAAISVERFFQFSVLGLVASGYLAIVGSGYLDSPATILAGAGLLLRALAIQGLVRVDVSDRAVNLLTAGYAAFYAADYLWVSREFLPATVHLVLFIAVLKVLTARSGRDYLYMAIVALLELLAAAMLSINFNFMVFLALFLVFAAAAGDSLGAGSRGNPRAHGGAFLPPAAHRRCGAGAAHRASDLRSGFFERGDAG
jgi:hypothetical protein